MKQVLLVTLFDDNYGNRLQNYALQTVLENQGFEVTNAIQPRPGNNNSKSQRIKDVLMKALALIGIREFKEKCEFKEVIRLRTDKFSEFNHKYIKNMIPIKYYDYSTLDLASYSYAITGSDQVWHNWDHVQGELDFFYLQFIEKEKRIAYAPSFGFSEFPEEDLNMHLTGLRKMNALSTREQKGAELIEKYVGRKAEVVLDPTMLLYSREWDKIIKKPDKEIPSKYLFLYFLGERTPAVINEYKRICMEKNFQLIDLYSKDSAFFSMGPLEFIWLIKNADYVCTDSFHAAVFSVLYHKKFTIFKRIGEGFENMFDRIENLLNEFGLMNRVFDESENYIKNLNSQIDIDWIKVDEILNVRREESLNYLKNALKI